MTRTYVVADLHGRFDLLVKAIVEIEQDAGPAGGHFICLGDFVDRGPDVKSIIEMFMAGPALPNWKWTILQGNHESMMLMAAMLPHGAVARIWGSNGAYATLQSYGFPEVEFEHCIPEEHKHWLAQLPSHYEDEHRIYVHAGIPMDKQLEDTQIQTRQWMMYRDGTSDWPDAEYHADGVHISGKHIVHGHVQSEDHPLLLAGRTNLDTWAYYTGRLAIGVFNDEVAGGPENIIYVYEDKSYD
jgi:serine/threonine protein phosphatase 1